MYGTEDLASEHAKNLAKKRKSSDQVVVDTFAAKAFWSARVRRPPASSLEGRSAEHAAQEVDDRQRLRNEIIDSDRGTPQLSTPPPWSKGWPLTAGTDARDLRRQLDEEYLQLDADTRKIVRAGGHLGEMVSDVNYRAPAIK